MLNIRNELDHTVVISPDGIVPYNLDLTEAFLCAVAHATDSRGLRVILPVDIPLGISIVQALESNLSRFGYKIVKTDERT